MNTTYAVVGAVGAGAMVRGIARIAAQAGSTVKLFDMLARAAAKGRKAVLQQWDKLRSTGRSDALRPA